MNATENLTTEALQMKVDSYGAIFAHGEYTLATFTAWTKGEGFGNSALVYRLAEQPVTGFGPDAKGRSECAPELIVEADHLCEHAGHAIAWALTQI